MVVGEVDQARALFEGGEPLLDAFAEHVPEMVPGEVRTLLAKFGLRAAHVLRPAAHKWAPTNVPGALSRVVRHVGHLWKLLLRELSCGQAGRVAEVAMPPSGSMPRAEVEVGTALGQDGSAPVVQVNGLEVGEDRRGQ
ncbi:hypothetical protein ACWGH8_06510 [Nonomuraea muscovyensis]